jgi:CubicO group peptidase (beta-lactamase class C family)
MAERVLAPLGMKSSTLLLSEVDPARLARPHEPDDHGVVHESAVFPYNRVHAGSSTLYSCIDDMLHWLEFNLGDGQSLLSPKMFAEQRRPRAVIPYPQLPPDTRIGLGLLMFERNGEMVMGHSGSDDGFVSIALFVPKRHAGIVAMGNLLNDQAQPEFWAMALGVLESIGKKSPGRRFLRTSASFPAGKGATLPACLKAQGVRPSCRASQPRATR